MSSSSRSPKTDRWRGALAALALGAALALPVPAAERGLPPHVAKYLADAKLAGSGRLTWWGFHVYDADLYVRGAIDPRQPTVQPFVLELRYARELSGVALAEASHDEIARLDYGTDAQRAAWHAQMARLFPDVRAGTRLAGVNLPGRGVRFYFEGRFIGAIDDADFARAFFAIWLDERTKLPKLREALMRDAPARRGA